MSEHHWTRVPTTEQLTEVWDGLDFSAFKALPDEEIDARKDAYLTRLTALPLQEKHDNGDLVFTEAGLELLDKGLVFQRYSSWRRHGIPDRDIHDDEVYEYVADLVASRREQNPDYGRFIAPEVFEGWDEKHVETALGILTYCLHMRDLTEKPIIDTYSLGNIVGHDWSLLDTMVEKNVIKLIGDYISPMGKLETYYLQPPFFDYFIGFLVDNRVARNDN